MKKQIINTTKHWLFYTSLSVLLFVSCQSPVKREITKNSINQDVEDIYEKNEELKPIHKSFLNYLNNEPYSYERNELVNFLEKSGLTYKYVFTILDSLELKLKPYELKRIEIIRQIDSTCVIIQQTIENQEKLRDSLNTLIIPNLLVGRKTTWDYYKDVIELKTMIKNNSEKVIQKVSFDLIFSNSNGAIFYIPCEHTGNIDIKTTFSFIIDDKSHKRQYELLNSIELPTYISSYQVKSIKYGDGRTSMINRKYFYNNLYTDKNYSQSPENTGYCPYLTRHNELRVSLEVANENYLSVVEEEASFMKDFFIKYLEKSINE